MKIKRQHQAITHEVEAKILDRLAKPLHKYLSADQLSALGVLGAVLAAIGYFLAARDMVWLNLVNFGIFLNWFGDSLDGRTARLRNENRPNYGHYLDHTLDAISMIIISVGLSYSGLTLHTEWVWVLVLYLMLMIHSFLKASVTGVFEMSFERMGPTEVRILAMLMNLVLWLSGNPVLIGKPYEMNLMDLAGFASILLMLYAYLGMVSRSLWGANKIREDD